MSTGDKKYAHSIDLPTEDVFRNLKNACHFAVDIGNRSTCRFMELYLPKQVILLFTLSYKQCIY
jgi:hypothetical protein